MRLGEDVNTFRSRLRADLGSGLGTLLSSCPEADEGSYDGAELRRLLVAQVGSFQRLDLAASVLVDGERVDHANNVVLLQPVELGHDLPLEIALAEAENEQLDGSECHHVSFRQFCGEDRGL